MTVRVCLAAKCLAYPKTGGHLWAYLNWALGFRALGCQVVWLELIDPDLPPQDIQTLASALDLHLSRYGLGGCLALSSRTNEPLSKEGAVGYLDLEACEDADLLFNMRYGLRPEVVRRFPRSALLDIDPGLLQVWVSQGHMQLAHHDRYFTIGETVGRPSSFVPDIGISWDYTPPCIALDWWPQCGAPDDAAFTTILHWYASGQLNSGEPAEDKRAGFMPFLDLPTHVRCALELAVNLEGDDKEWEEAERTNLRMNGWHLADPNSVASTPWDYQSYIQHSKGEFSCAKPSCIHLQNAWVSDRTLCYLASGKPAVVQHTGPSSFLPARAGMFRFRTLAEAIDCLETVISDYDRQSRLARMLAEKHFDAKKVVTRVLERVLS